MKNYKDSDYAINKSAKGIVYRFANQMVEVTFEDYLRDNPTKTASDFAALKTLSDADYYEADRRSYRQTWKNTSFDTLDEDEAVVFSAPSAEDEALGLKEQEEAYQKRQSEAITALSKLTEVQRRRYLMYNSEGLTIRQIAEKEGVRHQSVVECLMAADKKIRKFFSNL